MLMNYSKTLVAVLALLGIVASMGLFATVQAGGAGERRRPIIVTIVINPEEDEDPPCINPKRGRIHLAVLSTPTFFAALVDSATVGFGPRQADPIRVAFGDVNHDGLLDLLVSFRAKETGIKRGDTSASLSGETFPFLLEGTLRRQFITGTGTFLTVRCDQQTDDQED